MVLCHCQETSPFPVPGNPQQSCCTKTSDRACEQTVMSEVGHQDPNSVDCGTVKPAPVFWWESLITLWLWMTGVSECGGQPRGEVQPEYISFVYRGTVRYRSWCGIALASMECWWTGCAHGERRWRSLHPHIIGTSPECCGKYLPWWENIPLFLRHVKSPGAICPCDTTLAGGCWYHSPDYPMLSAAPWLQYHRKRVERAWNVIPRGQTNIQSSAAGLEFPYGRLHLKPLWDSIYHGECVQLNTEADTGHY